MTNDGTVKELLTGQNIIPASFADADHSDTIDLGHINSSQGVIYQMAEETKTQSSTKTPPPEGKTWAQVYVEEVDALVADGTKNADAVRQVAEKYHKTENSVRGGIFQYKKAHSNGNSPSPTTRRSRPAAQLSVDDYLANARAALEAARDLIDREVDEATAARDAAQARLDEVMASIKDRKADIEKKLKALE